MDLLDTVNEEVGPDAPTVITPSSDLDQGPEAVKPEILDDLASRVTNFRMVELPTGARTAVIGSVSGMTIARVQPDDIMLVDPNSEGSDVMLTWLRGRTVPSNSRDGEFLVNGLQKMLNRLTSGGLITVPAQPVVEVAASPAEAKRSESYTGSTEKDPIVSAMLKQAEQMRERSSAPEVAEETVDAAVTEAPPDKPKEEEDES